MKTEKALQIVSTLADGIDPINGEIYPPDSPYQQPDIVRALFRAIHALEHLKRYEARRARLPENAGKPWSTEEERRLLSSFDSGIGINDLATQHERTPGAVRSRLERLGGIQLS